MNYPITLILGHILGDCYVNQNLAAMFGYNFYGSSAIVPSSTTYHGSEFFAILSNNRYQLGCIDVRKYLC